MTPKTSLLLALSLAVPLGLAGCITAPESADGATVETDPVLEAVEPHAVMLDGSLGVSAVVCPLVVCLGYSPVPSDRIFPMEDVSGELSRVELTATWDASSPTVEDLRLGVFTCVPDACGSDADLTQVEYVDGPSPLVLELEGFSVPEGETLHVFVWSPSITPGLFTVLTTPMDFHVEGTILPAGAMEAEAEKDHEAEASAG